MLSSQPQDKKYLNITFQTKKIHSKYIFDQNSLRIDLEKTF